MYICVYVYACVPSCKTINRSHAHRTHRQRKHPRHRKTSRTNTERETAQRRLIVEVVVAEKPPSAALLLSSLLPTRGTGHQCFMLLCGKELLVTRYLRAIARRYAFICVYIKLLCIYVYMFICVYVLLSFNVVCCCLAMRHSLRTEVSLYSLIN